MRRLPVAYRPEARRDPADIFANVLRVSRNLFLSRLTPPGRRLVGSDH